MADDNLQERLDRLRESADASARNFRTVYVSYLVIALYIPVIVSSTNHEILFRADDVQAPIINVGVPVAWFFTFVPWILLLLHFNLLLQGFFLSRKVHAFKAALPGTHKGTMARGEQLDLLFPSPLAHMVGGADSRRGTRFLLWAMVNLSVAVLPLAILIYAEVQFLPYQSETITWMHRAVVIVDFTLLWWLWPRLATPGQGWREWWWGKPRWRAGGVIVTMAGLFFVVGIADFPGGAVDKLLPFEDGRDILARKYSLSNRVLIAEEPSPEILSAYVVGCGRTGPADAGNKSESAIGGLCDLRALEVGSLVWCKHAKPLHLSGRSFRHADLSGSTLCAAELELADLSDASLMGAQLYGANLFKAELHGANLMRAELLGADLGGPSFAARTCAGPSFTARSCAGPSFTART